MSSKSAIIDTSALLALWCLHKEGMLEINLLSLLFNKILIPHEVEKEFLQKKEKGIFQLAPQDERFSFYEIFLNRGLFEKCNDYDYGIVALYHEKLDKGESEALAQYRDRNSGDEVYITILDDKKARKLAINENIRRHGILQILFDLVKKLNLNASDFKKWMNFLTGDFCNRRFPKNIINEMNEQLLANEKTD